MSLYDRKYFFETDGKDFLFPFISQSYNVCRNRGYKCVRFSDFDNNLEKKYEKGDVVFGSVEKCKIAFEINDVETPKYIGYPKELNHFYRREIFEMDYSRVMYEPLPFFVKPKDEVKRFTGTVVTTEQWKTIVLNGHEKCKFFVSKVLDISSEWRVFVHKGKIYGCECYDGDRLMFPNAEFIKNAVKVYEESENSIVSYTIDVGIQPDGTNFVIELNDMWGTGIYGAPEVEYVDAHIDRWKQILNKND